MFIRFQKFFFICLSLALIVDFTLPVHAQNNSDIIILNPYGTDYREPRLYGKANDPDPVKQPDPIKIPTPVSQPVETTPVKETVIDTNVTKNLFNNVLKKKLRLDYAGVGKTCQAGSIEAIPWTLTDRGVGIENAESLTIVAKQALEADHRLRRISISDSKIDLYYLEPARIFGFIPVNYTFHITADVNTFEFRLQNPKWLKFASHYHNEIAQTVSDGLYTSFSKENVQFLADKNIFVRHATVIEQTAKAFQNISIYPFSNTFWICVFIPYFIFFLLLIGSIIGFIWYLLSRRRKQKHIQLVRNGEYEFKRPQPRFERNPEDDTETLEDYMNKKKAKQDTLE